MACVCLFMLCAPGQELKGHQRCVPVSLSGLCYAEMSAWPTSLSYLLAGGGLLIARLEQLPFLQADGAFSNQVFVW